MPNGAKPYPRDSYPRLKAACAIDETAALRSASWGLGQVLGENFRAAGFLTVQAMVEAMMADEALQLAAAVNFIAANRLDGRLRKHDWAGFAKGYNGASYAKNAYDIRLAEAFRKWSGIRDTPPPPAPVPIPQPPQPKGSTPAKAEPGKAGVRRGPFSRSLSGLCAAVLAPLVAAILSLFRKAPSLFRKVKP
ncbi:N-acetylmuramidase domain-containing protein [Mesorhizobium sp.]|uniref:N-acetylmuramidase domain-containing protein n=1 Tax=Mesorhizobium sp. TaxID=1871066 RepID=UPI00257A6138|nr:N-acetylmuramidase domain-containing protein [Mesorhizobium sp.]